MKWNEFKTAAVVFALPLFVLWGCQGNKLVSPSRVTNLSVSVPISSNLKASLLGASTNEILYNVSVPGSAPVTGVYGPFSTNSESGSVNFVITGIPSGGTPILALQLNDASTHQPLAVGAAVVAAVANVVTVELGSVARSCYVVSMDLAGCSSDHDEEFNFQIYGYDYDEFGALPENTGYYGLEDTEDSDVAFISNTDCDSYDIVDAWTGYESSVAYMGNGDLVNFASVPPDSAFHVDGATGKAALSLPDTMVEVNDVYCVKLNGGTVPGHAWVQIISPGNSNSGPTFRYRVNLDQPCYTYYQTSADLAAETGLVDCALIPDWDITGVGIAPEVSPHKK